MSGLLKQLQKPKKRKTAADDLLTKPHVSVTPLNPTSPVKDEPSPIASEEVIAVENKDEDKTSEVNPEITQTIVRTKDKSVKIVRRNPTKGDEAEEETKSEIPWWLVEDSQTTPQIEMLIPEARRMLNEILPQDGEEDIDLSIAVRRATALAANSLRSEVRISESDQETAAEELLKLLTGKGPLQPLYDDPDVTDIFIDDHQSIRVIRRGQAVETPFYFRSPEEYRAYVNAMLQSVERVLNLSSPIVDCVLDDGYRSRVSAIDSSVVDGDEPRVCIRVPRLQKISFFDLLQTKTLPASLAAWLAEVVACGDANILVLGPTGSGKTVSTTAMLSNVGSDERIITIEDVPEIFVPTAHLEKLVARPANAQGEGEVLLSQLLRAALRRAPHRIVVGEIRDEEGRLFLRALETGHAGSIATIHANSSKDSLWRLLDVVQAYETSPQDSIQRRIARSLDLLVTMKKIDGTPCLVEVAEVLEPRDGDFVVKPLVRFDGIVDSKRQWKIMSESSKWIDKLRERGIELRPGPSMVKNAGVSVERVEL